MTCFCVVGPGSVDVNSHFLLQVLCQYVGVSLCQCFDWCQCFRPCVTLTRHCVGDILQGCSQVTVLPAVVQSVDMYHCGAGSVSVY